MRKILSLLLILALFLPCALAETPQGIDLALTSTYGDGLSLRMTAGLGETPFCSLTLPSGQIDLAFSPDKGLCVQSGGQWAQLLVEGHPVDAALLTTPLKLLDGRSPSEALGLLAEDVNKMLDAIPSLYNLPMTLIRDPAFARLFSDLYIAAQTGTISITSEELNRMAASVLGKIYSMEYLDGLNFSDIYHNLLASVVQSSEVARAYRSAMRGYLLSNFRLSGQIGIDKGELLFSQPYQEPYHLTYEQTTPNSWHYLLTTANSDTIDGVLYWRNEYDFALSGYSENQHTAFSVTCSYGSANNFVFIASVDNSFSLSIVQAGSNFSLRLNNENANVFALNANVFPLNPHRIISVSRYITIIIRLRSPLPRMGLYCCTGAHFRYLHRPRPHRAQRSDLHRRVRRHDIPPCPDGNGNRLQPAALPAGRRFPSGFRRAFRHQLFADLHRCRRGSRYP